MCFSVFAVIGRKRKIGILGMSTLNKNIAANYVSQLYVTLIGILILPLYVKFMGAEAYGLIGFFTMLQSWFMLLDMGLTPTISRETARYKAGALEPIYFLRLFRALSVIFLFVAFVGAGGLLLSSNEIAGYWLNVNNLSANEVGSSLKIIAVLVALRWCGGLYRGVITGAEQFFWLSIFNICIATLRFVAVFISMSFYGYSIEVFFYHQLAVAVLEVSGLFYACSKVLPKAKSFPEAVGWSFKPVKNILKFSLSIAFTASVWVMVTQTDKMVLSGILPLDEYGYFSMAVLMASGIMVISGPISNALMPRLAKLNASSKYEEMIDLYRKSTRMVAGVAGVVVIVFASCADQIVYVWTGNAEYSDSVAPVLRLYSLGNGFLVLSAFSYYLQYAKGNLRYHLIGNGVLLVFLIPLVVVASIKYGGIGAGYVWLGLNLVFFVCWVGYIHKKIVPGLHMTWLTDDIGKTLMPSIVLGFFIFYVESYMSLENRVTSLFFLMGASLMLMVSMLATFKDIRSKLVVVLQRIGRCS